MKIATGLLCLILSLLTFFPQQSASERTVALIFPDRVEIVKESEARAEYDRLLKTQAQTPSADARFVALKLALGTVQQPQSLPRNNTREFLNNEIRRGVRKPAQGENYFPEEGGN